MSSYGRRGEFASTRHGIMVLPLLIGVIRLQSSDPDILLDNRMRFAAASAKVCKLLDLDNSITFPLYHVLFGPILVPILVCVGMSEKMSNHQAVMCWDAPKRSGNRWECMYWYLTLVSYDTTVSSLH